MCGLLPEPRLSGIPETLQSGIPEPQLSGVPEPRLSGTHTFYLYESSSKTSINPYPSFENNFDGQCLVVYNVIEDFSNLHTLIFRDVFPDSLVNMASQLGSGTSNSHLTVEAH